MDKSKARDINLPHYLTEKEVAKLTCRSVSSLQNDRWKSRGIPYYKEKKKITYSLRDILDYMDQHRVEPEGEYDN